MIDPILDNLNPQQFAAVTAPDGPLLIIAGAGSGKTRVITRRLAFLVRERGVRPWQMFAATFTNKAAQEMRHRVAEISQGTNPADYHISTFHSMCARILRVEGSAIGLGSNFTICDDKDQKSALKTVLKELDIEEKLVSPSDAQYVINQAKMRMLDESQLDEVASSNLEIYEAVFQRYHKYMAESSSVDFEDLILKTVRLFQDFPDVLRKYQERYRYLMVDEYQDTNKVQVELISLIAQQHQNLTVVGDEDQSIYSWRGADITNILKFQKHFPDARTIRLEQNYRSTGNILKAADAVITNNDQRLGKTLFTEDGDGPPIYMMVGRNGWDEAEGVARSIEAMQRRGYRLSDMALFYRVASLSRSFEDAVRQVNIPYRMIGGTKFYERAEIKDLISYLQVAANPHNSIAMLRIINTPRRGLGAKSLETISDFATRNGISFFEAMTRIGGEPGALPRGTLAKVERFVDQVRAWKNFAEHNSPSSLLEKIIAETDYENSLGDPGSIEVQSRRENIAELVTSIVAREGENSGLTLTDYLENVSLVSMTDDLDPDDDAVSMMTLHAAKGLEYKVVFMVGVEETLFPNQRAVVDRGDYEEERRLFYVGITRAREYLVITRAVSRLYYGDTRHHDESRFVHELPQEILRPLDPYDPVFHDTLEEAPEDMDVPQFEQPSYTPTYEKRYAPARVPFGSGPQYSPRSRQQQAAAPAVRGRALELGTRVSHALLGDGIVTGVSGGGSDLQYIIQMDDGTEHMLIARYAKLTVLKDD